jgi:formate-dependent nitrite reductase membrane component NrfD
VWPLDSAPNGRALALGIPLLALFFLAVTSLLLVLDLKRPERFFLILTHPNSKSWLVRGTYALIAYGTLLTFGGLWSWLGIDAISLGYVYSLSTMLAGLVSAGYTGWLFGQAKGRVLWMQQGLWLRLMLQAVAAGAGLLLVVGPRLGVDSAGEVGLNGVALVSVGLLLFFTVFEGQLAPKGRAEEYARTLALIKRGPYAKEHAFIGLFLGMLLPMVLLAFAHPLGVQLAGVLILVGLWSEKSVLVRAGQALPIS